MISVDQALELVRKNTLELGNESVSLENCRGRDLAEDIIADRDFPPYNRSAMDGIAIRIADFENGCRRFEILGDQYAGAPANKLEISYGCYEIMTGAVVPEGADCVIRYEDLSIKNGLAEVLIDQTTQWKNIHIQGADEKAGAVIIPRGKQLDIGDIGILATVGKSKFEVREIPSVAILSTGDELVDVDKKPEPHQIRKSNSHMLRAILSKDGLTASIHHLNDDPEELKIGLTDLISTYDVLLISGGVSKGKKDFLPTVLQEIGIKEILHRVAQRPGKPFWFGRNDHTVVFGFPGNPVSTLACYCAYFRHWLQTLQGIERELPSAKLTGDITFEPELTYHVPVKTHFDGNELIAEPYRGNGSGDLANLSHANAFISLPADRSNFRAGEAFPIRFF